MDNDLRNKIERFKIKAEGFLKENIKAFIIDTNDTWYSCDIISVDDISFILCNFEGDKIGVNQTLFWADIIKFDIHKGEVQNG